MPTVSVVDYGMGNLESVSRAFEKSGARVKIAGDAKTILSSDAVVLPGVGAFDEAVSNLKKTGLWRALPEIVARKPFFGICLGLQLLFEGSEEGESRGLGILRGRSKRFPRRKNLAVPHMGWNTVDYAGEKPRVMKNIPPGSYFYFVHSYYAAPADSGVVACRTNYGASEFCSAASFDKAFACQFHPEKSGETGLKIIKNFVVALR